MKRDKCANDSVGNRKPVVDRWHRPDIQQSLRLCSELAAGSGEATRKYYGLLNTFVETCHNLVQGGCAYLAVLLCHELYRFLYPTDSYAGFVHEDPVPSVTSLLEKILGLAEQFASVVHPYSLGPQDLQALGNMDLPLEQATSALYTSLWSVLDRNALLEESSLLLRKRMSQELLEQNVRGKDVLDMGCGSGRYSIALALAGAKRVVGLDLERKAFSAAERWCRDNDLAVDFVEGNFHRLPFPDSSFDFVFCNGVLHHSSSIKRGLEELFRVLKTSASAFLYLYAAGGIFWYTRLALRGIFSEIPIDYTLAVLRLIGMPSNRFIFCDTWYVPREVHTSRADLEAMLADIGFSFRKIVSLNPFDLDGAIERNVPGARDMWGDGEHRYLLGKNCSVRPFIRE